MFTSARREKQTNATPSINEHLPHPQMEEKQKQVQTEIEEWKWSTQQHARHEAGKRQGPLALGNIEAQLKRLSEQVTRTAQEKQEYIRTLLKMKPS